MLLGFTYDAGFFWEMDYQLYSAFSLTEHTVFALQALPIGLSVIGVASMIYMSQFLKYFARSLLLRVIGMAFAALFLSGFCYLIGASSTAMACLMAFTFVLSYSDITYLGVVISTLSVLLPTIFFAFSMGIDSEVWVTKRPLSHELTFQGNSPVMGKVIRAGSIGFLYLDDKKRPIFRKWDGVISIVRVK